MRSSLCTSIELNGNLSSFRDVTIDILVGRGASDSAPGMLKGLTLDGANICRRAIAFNGGGQHTRPEERPDGIESDDRRFAALRVVPELFRYQCEQTRRRRLKKSARDIEPWNTVSDPSTFYVINLSHWKHRVGSHGRPRKEES